MLGITSFLDRFLKHNLVHGFFDTFFPITQAQSHYALYTLLDEQPSVLFVNCIAKLVFVSVFVEADDSAAPAQ